MIILYWIFFYTVPAGVAVWLKSKQKLPIRRASIMHGSMLVSILLLSIVGTRLNIEFQVSYALLIAVSFVASVSFLGWMAGVGYAVSSVIQEYCLLLAAVVLLPVREIKW